MDDFVKLDAIEYKIFPRGRKCLKSNICAQYPAGSILIYKNSEEHIKVSCVVKTDMADPIWTFAEIVGLDLPESTNNYDFVYIVPAQDQMQYLKASVFLLRRLISCRADAYSIRVYRQCCSNRSDSHLVVMNVPNNHIEEYDRLYGLCYYSDVGEVHMPAIDSVEKQIKLWYGKTSFKQFLQAIEERVTGQENLSLVLLNVYLYLQSIAKDLPSPRVNMLLIGPSGCGKTETMRALRDYFEVNIPMLVVSLIDMNQVTSEGFKGNDTRYIVSGLSAGNSDGIGLVFLDEFDKKLIPQYSGNGDNVSREVQHQILATIEGYTIDGVDTSKTMFIGMGSFDVVRERREAKAVSSGKFGFGADKESTKIDHFAEITREEILELGACNELIGRFGLVVNFGSLSYEAIDRIINIRVKEISESSGFNVSISDEMRSYLHENSNTKFGNRLIESLIREAVSLALVNILTEEKDADEITVTGRNRYTIFNRSQQHRCA